MTDPDHGYRTLLRAIDGMDAGRYVTVDLIRDECDAAGLSSAEKSGALTTAAHQGYITGVFMLLPGWSTQPIHAAVPSQHPAGKSRLVKLWRRTALPVPAHVCQMPNVVGSQQDSWDNGDSKTAPGVASTNTESLAHSEAAKPHGRTCIT